MRETIFRILVVFIGMIYASSHDSSFVAKRRLFYESWNVKLALSNDDVQVQIHPPSGRFTIGTTDGRPLLYGFPYGGGTSHIHFNVDGVIKGAYNTTSPEHPDPAPMITSPHLVSGSAVCVWEYGGVRFKQTLRPVYIWRNALIKIEYEITNVDVIPHNAGILLFFDTMIGSNDMAPISTPFGYSANELQFLAPAIPSFWQAFELSPFQPAEFLMGFGILFGGSSTPPDMLICGDYWNYRGAFWDVSFAGGTFNDSAVIMRWGTYTLAPSETKHIVTYYGKGNCQNLSGMISISITSPEQILPYGCGGYDPDTFFVNLLASVTDTLTDCTLRLTLPDFLTSLSPLDTSGLTLSPGVVYHFAWQVVVNSPFNILRTGDIVAEVTPPIGSPVSISRPIEILPGSIEPPLVINIESHSSILYGASSRWRWLIHDEDGVIRDDITVRLDGIPIPYFWYGETLEARITSAPLGTHTLTLSSVSDSGGCFTLPITYNFDIIAPDVRTSLISPQQGVYWSCEEDTAIIYLSGIIVDNIYCDAFPLSIYDVRADTYFVPLPTLFDGMHNITVMGRVCERDTAIQWSFTTDFSPPRVQSSPVILTLTSPSDVISFAITDDLAGVDWSSVQATLSTGYDSVVLSHGSPGFSISGEIVQVVPGNSGLIFSGCDTLSIRIFVKDLANGCGNNTVDTTMQNILIPCTSPVASIVSPLGPFSCETLFFSARVIDADGISWDSIWIRINDETLPRDELRISEDTIFASVLMSSYPDGYVTFEIGGIYDVWRNSLDTSFSFLLDRTPPRISSIEPLPESNLTGTENINIQIQETGTGLDTLSFYAIVENETIRIGSGCIYDGSQITILPSTWLSEVSEDERIRICVYMRDMIVECVPNLLDICWEYNITQHPTVISMLSPTPNCWLGCADQLFRSIVIDLDGIEWSSARVLCNEIPVEFVNSGDTINFTLELDEFSNNSQITVNILISDSLGFHAETSFTYFIDREAPLIVPLIPWGTMLSPNYSPVSFTVEDNLSGVNVNSITITIDDVSFSLSDTAAVELSGNTLKFFPEHSGLTISGYTEFEISAKDNTLGCPNMTTIRGNYNFAEPQIWWNILSPVGVSACPDVLVKVSVNSQVSLDFSEIYATCNGQRVDVSYIADTVIAEISSSILNNGVNTVMFTGFRALGTTTSDTIYVPLVFDNLPPVITPIYPLAGQNVLQGTPAVLIISDDISGVDRNNVYVSFNELQADTISWRGDTLIAVPPRNISGNVEFCVNAHDIPQYCAPNSSRICWNYSIIGDAPTISVIEPPIGAFTHNRRQRISWRIIDPNGIEYQSLWTQIDGNRYDITSSELNYADGILTFTPSADYSDGDTIKWSVNALNVLGFESMNFGSFICDFSPPTVSSPSPTGVITSEPSEISVDITDNGVGVDPASITFNIGELTIGFDNYALTYEYPRAILNLHNANIHLSRGDSVSVCISASDINTGLGTPNSCDNFCFSFLLTTSECRVGPNPFTPNNDGINDIVELFAPTDKQFETKIFTLNGSIIWKSTDYGVSRWNGIDINGHPAPIGTYLYTISQEGKTICKGFIVLAR